MKKCDVFRAGILMMALAFVFSGCSKDDDQELRDQEMRILQQYLKDNNITQEPTASGLYYLPITEGTGTRPMEFFIADLDYTIELVDGTVLGTTYEDVATVHDIYFDEILYGPIRLLIGNTGRPGLDEGLQLMSVGGKAQFIVPSDINGFGKSSTALSPSYSTHIYKIDLIAAFDDPEEFQAEQISMYLTDHAVDSVFITESGLHYIEMQSGEGELIKDGDNVEIRYTGSYLDGRIFDSNLEGTIMSLRMPADNYIDAWDEALKLMRKGSRAKIIVPYELGYKDTGSGDRRIPPYKTLVFELEIEDVVSPG